MDPLQTLITELLLETGASRAMLQLVRADGRSPIAAEAVTHGLRQVRNSDIDVDLSPVFRRLERERKVLVQDAERNDPAMPRHAIDDESLHAQMLAPVVVAERLAGIIAVHHARDARRWEAKEIEAVAKAQSKAAAVLEGRKRQSLAATSENLRDAAVQAILDGVRQTLGVQRCTFRQDVLPVYAFPVTHESRQDGVRSLLGDFTIVQSGQPVIVKLLSERAQVVQEDCRSASAEPLFHVMLKHYGDMRAQIVTPFIRDDKLAGVLSIHDLRAPRKWTREEMKLARDATHLIGQLFSVSLE